MERLTSIDGAGRNIIELKKFCDNDDWIISESKDKITIKISSKAINKLAEFEDFMEENEFYDLQSLKDNLYQANMELYKMKTLKYRWQKLKEYIDTFKEYNVEEANLAWKIINKIQELENGE